MKRVWWRRIVMVIVGLLLVGGFAYALRPQPIPVDLAVVTRGTLQISIDEDGVTRIRERYTISAPLSGRLLRVLLDPGDDVDQGQLLLVIEPSDPELLDARSHAEATARVNASSSAVEEAEAELARVTATLESAQRDYEDQQAMIARDATTDQELDDARLLVQVRTQEQTSARFAVQVARYQLELAKAAIVHTAGHENGTRSDARLEITAPCNGRVLRVFQESEGYIDAGTPLLEFGDTSDLEVVVDVLSTDAVSITPGDRVQLEHWGGTHTLNGRVRVIEPAAFTKVSSLGVEEQRVNIIIDFTDPPQARAGLGDGFRVEAAIVVWQEEDVLKAPSSALFRSDDQWSVFRVKRDIVERVPIQIGQRNGTASQVLEGLKLEDTVIIYPPDTLEDGAKIIQR